MENRKNFGKQLKNRRRLQNTPYFFPLFSPLKGRSKKSFFPGFCPELWRNGGGHGMMISEGQDAAFPISAAPAAQFKMKEVDCHDPRL